jgi:HEAT repeat protein
MNFSLITRGICASLTAAAVLLLTGCGGEKAEKVDINAQAAALSGDADAKVTALSEISKVGAEAASLVPKIQPLLKDEDAAVRRTAAYVLGTIGPAAKAAVPDLKAMLDTQDRDQLTAVANALRAIDPSSLPGMKVENTAPGGGGE